MDSSSFPREFLWGTATSAYQVEGAVGEDGRGSSIWDTFSHLNGTTIRGDTGDVACDHYHCWQTDLQLLSDLGVNSYRFSVAWPRVMPNGSGVVNQAGLDFYERLVDRLLELNIAPMVTLYHWDLPQALQDCGGWANRETSARFAEYVRVVADRLGDRVPYWITLNEPYCSAFVGNLEGRHAPGLRDEATALAVLHHLLVGHGEAAEVLRTVAPKAKVGITLNLTSVRPASGSPEDIRAARNLDLYENRMFLEPLFKGAYPADAAQYYEGITDFDFVQEGDLRLIGTPLDFLGINYYERHAATADRSNLKRGWIRVPPSQPTISGISVEPIGLREVLERVSREYASLPLIVTETGLALFDYVSPDRTINDQERIDYYVQHLEAAAEALRSGVNLVGFFAWSFLDNFEWAWGYGYRFGMYYVDYATQERIPKESAKWYASWLRNINGG